MHILSEFFKNFIEIVIFELFLYCEMYYHPTKNNKVLLLIYEYTYKIFS